MTAPSLPAPRRTNTDRDNHNWKLSDDEIKSICEDIQKGKVYKEKWRKFSSTALAEKYGVHPSTIYYIERNKMENYINE